MTCKCERWQKNMRWVNEIFIFANAHKVFYKGAEFDCCPWCGLRLRQNEYEPDELGGIEAELRGIQIAPIGGGAEAAARWWQRNFAHKYPDYLYDVVKERIVRR